MTGLLGVSTMNCKAVGNECRVDTHDEAETNNSGQDKLGSWRKRFDSFVFFLSFINFSYGWKGCEKRDNLIVHIYIEWQVYYEHI